jgi:hypothetical protein
MEGGGERERGEGDRDGILMSLLLRLEVYTCLPFFAPFWFMERTTLVLGMVGGRKEVYLLLYLLTKCSR